MNSFIFIIPFRNVENYIEECALSLITQDYSNWKAIFIDDNSTDNSVDRIPNDYRFTIIRNIERKTALPNIHNAIMNSDLEEENIICLLDGDDKLINNTVCSTLNNIYTISNPLLTYGQYITSHGSMGHCRPYSEYMFSMLRNGGYLASHLRTFKFKAYLEIINQDNELLCFKNSHGEFYKTCYDVAIMTPLMEISGLKNIYYNSIPLYWYRLHDSNDHVLYGYEQKETETEIFRKNPFKRKF